LLAGHGACLFPPYQVDSRFKQTHHAMGGRHKCCNCPGEVEARKGYDLTDFGAKE
jgi:hypothetical protein